MSGALAVFAVLLGVGIFVAVFLSMVWANVSTGLGL